MALAKPILVSKGTTMVDYIERYGIGLAVTYGNEEECLRAVKRLSQNKLEYEEMARKSTQSYEEFSAKKMKSLLIEHYQTL